MTETVLQLQNVSKKFGHFQALTHVNLTVNQGDIYALIGQNGAGKTTLMRMVAGLSPISQGTIMLLGENANRYRHALSRTGAVIETPVAFNNLTVVQNLKVTAIQHGLTTANAISEAIRFVGLEAKKSTKARHLSLGQRQRLGLATAILAHPDFLILDEPINGLDPTGIIEFRELLHRLNAEKRTTILISSHILTELYQVATRFGFLHQGTVIKEVTKRELDEANQAGLVVSVTDIQHASQLLDQHGVHDFIVLNDQAILIPEKQIEPAKLNQLLVGENIGVNSITERESSLEEYFATLLKEQEAAQ